LAKDHSKVENASKGSNDLHVVQNNHNCVLIPRTSNSCSVFCLRYSSWFCFYFWQQDRGDTASWKVFTDINDHSVLHCVSRRVGLPGSPAVADKRPTAVAQALRGFFKQKCHARTKRQLNSMAIWWWLISHSQAGFKLHQFVIPKCFNHPMWPPISASKGGWFYRYLNP